MAQSTSSAVPSLASATRPASRTAATRRAGRDTCSGRDSSSASSPSAVARGAPRSAGSMPREAKAIRTARRSRRRSRTVAPPSGEASSASAAGSSSPTATPSVSGPDRAGSSAVSALSSGATAGCPASGRSSDDTATGTPADASARRSGPSAPGRADDDGHLRPRQVVEQVRAAQDVGQVGRLDRRGPEDVHLGGPGSAPVDRRQPPVLPRPGQALGDLPADPQQLRARPPADAQRDPSGRPAAGVPEALGELDDAPRLGAAEGVDGLVGVADGDQVAAAPGEQLEQLDLGGVGVLVLVDEQPARALALLAQQLGVAVELGDRLPDQLGRVVARTRHRARRWRRR